MVYKGFQLPQDAALFVFLPLRMLRYHLLLKRHSAHSVTLMIRSRSRQIPKQKHQNMDELTKCRRIVDHILVCRLRFQKPCLLRCLTLLNEALRRGIPADLCIGAKNEGSALAGHSWLEIDGAPFMEDPGQIAEYTRMTKE